MGRTLLGNYGTYKRTSKEVCFNSRLSDTSKNFERAEEQQPPCRCFLTERQNTLWRLGARHRRLVQHMRIHLCPSVCLGQESRKSRLQYLHPSSDFFVSCRLAAKTTSSRGTIKIWTARCPVGAKSLRKKSVRDWILWFVVHWMCHETLFNQVVSLRLSSIFQERPNAFCWTC